MTYHCSKIFDDVREILVQVNEAVYGLFRLKIRAVSYAYQRRPKILGSIKAKDEKIPTMSINKASCCPKVISLHTWVCDPVSLSAFSTLAAAPMQVPDVTY